MVVYDINMLLLVKIGFCDDWCVYTVLRRCLGCIHAKGHNIKCRSADKCCTLRIAIEQRADAS